MAKYKPINRFPSSAFDLSIIADETELVGNIEEQLHRLSGDELESLAFVRIYSGPPLPEGKKSVSFRLTVAAQDRTLSLDEIGAIRSRLIDGMRAAGYDLRV